MRKYEHVYAPDAPRTIREAVKLIGTHEVAGSANNRVILAWAREVAQAIGVDDLGYNADSIPWCGLAAAVVCVRSGWSAQVPKTPLWARSWAVFGNGVDVAGLGDVLVFSREGGGHVGFYVAEDDANYHVLGGNQNDEFNIKPVAKKRCIAIRRPKWRVAQPATVRPVHVTPGGVVSTNEA